MRTKPEPGVYVLTIDGWPDGLIITVTEEGCIIGGFFLFNWAEDAEGPILRCGRFAFLSFTPPNLVDLVVKKADGSMVYLGQGTYAPA